MKAVLLRKRKFTYKDFFRVLLIISMHFVLFYIYYMILFGINFAVSGQFMIVFHGAAWLILYPMSLGPLINSIIHIIYAEGGFLWFRASMWFHTFFILFLAPIVIFIMAGA